jgi:hypothetical protein
MVEIRFPMGGKKAFDEARPTYLALSRGESVDLWALRDILKRFLITYPVFNCSNECDLKIMWCPSILAV